MARLNINGKIVNLDVEPDTPLLWAIREQIGLTGTKYGCGVAACGACTVHVDGVPTRSCSLPVSSFTEKQKIVTIEGLAKDGKLHPMQEAFRQNHGLQCGFCTPGMIMSATELLAKNSQPTREEIKEGLAGNLCRCTGYFQIVEAILAAAQETADKEVRE